MREPSATLVVDSAILLSGLLGRSIPAIIQVGRLRRLATTSRVAEEVRRRIVLGLKQPALLPLCERLIAEMTVVAVTDLATALPAAELALREAVPSRNGSTSDAHVVALAWALDADIWSADRDFAGAGQASWSTANLIRALAR